MSVLNPILEAITAYVDITLLTPVKNLRKQSSDRFSFQQFSPVKPNLGIVKSFLTTERDSSPEIIHDTILHIESVRDYYIGNLDTSQH